jgi:hypothetical protein
MTTLYGILDADARNWWYHRDLRKAGKTGEARRRERESIRSSLRSLRQARENGGWISVGRGGYTLHYSDCGKVQGYGGANAPTVRAARHIGLPFVDTTTIPDDLIVSTMSLPMPKADPASCDPAPWGGMSFCPVRELVAVLKQLGATVDGWGELPDPDPSKFRAMTKRESKMLRAFASGDEGGLFEAMHDR